MSILISGCYGFIGSHVAKKYIETTVNEDIILLDGMTYAANPDYLKGYLKTVNHQYPIPTQIIADIRDSETIESIIKYHKPRLIIHLAAESHVCNSIKGPRLFYETNTMGTLNLLEGVRKHASKCKFIHVSTDEVFGELPFDPCVKFSVESPIDPRSPYASSKAASDLMALAYYYTYGIDVMVTNCSNNYGPNQHYEKLIPKTIKSIFNGQSMTVHGTGENIRDWIYVNDHVSAIKAIERSGSSGQRYLIGGDNEQTNISIINKVYEVFKEIWDEEFPNIHCPQLNITYTNDRPTDDKRYAIESNTKSLGWSPSQPEKPIKETVQWYFDMLKKDKYDSKPTFTL